MENKKIFDPAILLKKIELYKSTLADISAFFNEVYQSIESMIDEAMDYADHLEKERDSLKKEIVELKKTIHSLEEKNQKYEALLNEFQNKEIVK